MLDDYSLSPLVETIHSRTPLSGCDINCTVSLHLGIPCQHTTHRELADGMKLTTWDVHSRLHLYEWSSNPYRRIHGLRIATELRERPKK
ncbi:hypothetical protein BKA67DRAFT_578928 [Truncatella angustata]|uniref:Uncharacterized protein n=1 Tax=Truncatella angustata TaxID=152316 RepID=A0A9P8UDK0_9PEZI|nr:uncharacterized protein BKA67DRAFT_578928 [Truncatella angustata]KAH6647934.1 hypothetical protein BKA67DRAFT_578928 [Truncatella angustata]